MQKIVQKQKSKVIALVGPTASGKTALGIALAKKFNGEIISADSRQIYRGMDIGTGKVTKRDMNGVPHHMLSILSPKRTFSAGEFAKRAQKEIAQIIKRDRVPIIVGGTGFYVDALLGPTLPDVPPNPVLRKKLSSKSAPQLFAMLQKLDPARAQTIDPNNPPRLIRAIEIAAALGKVPSRDQSSFLQKATLEVLWLGIEPPADKAYEKKIRVRVTLRLKRGMLAEAKALRASVSRKRWHELGVEFRLLGDLLDKKISREEFIERLTAWELLYAKRQLRYLRRNKEIRWIKTEREALSLATKFLRNTL